MAIRKPEVKYTQLFINNEFVDSVSKEKIPVTNPSTEETFIYVASAQKEDIDIAVAAAKKAFQKGSPWRTMDASARGKLLFKFADLLERDINYIASLDTYDNGKPFTNAVGDVHMAISLARYYGSWADKIHGNTIPADMGLFSMTRKEPVGVVGQITPWNFPAMLCVQKLAPALATGCTLVLKPSEVTPLTALYIASLTKEAGFPDGVVNIVPGYGNIAGQAISEHPDIQKVCFTGSTAVGHKIMAAAAASNLKRVTFELGGKSPFVICEDNKDNLEKAASMAIFAALANQGQTCCAGTRTFVHASIYDDFVKKTVELMKKRVVGDPYDPKTEQGPQVSKIQMDRILGYIEKGKKEGAKLVLGGKRIDKPGYYIEPTIFADVTDDMTIAKEEIFGPVMSIFKYVELDDAIRRSNETLYGLAAGILTKDINKSLKYAKEVESGSVWVNTFLMATCQTPFGGYKKSGQGREMGEDGLDEYLETKTITIKIED